MQKLNILILVFLLSGWQSSIGQNIPVVKGKATKAATIDVLSLKGLDDNSIPKQIKIPNRNWKTPEWTFDEKDVIYMETEGKRTLKQIREVSPMPDTTFAGISDNGNSIPPDVNGAAGPNHVMVTLNTQVRIQDRQGNDLFTTSLSTWWSSLPGYGSTFDPKIVYDPYENRWIMVTASSSSPQDSKLFIGVSVTDDPSGEWHMYWIDPDESNVTWFDYPNLGFNKKWIAVGGNMFGGDFYSTVFTFDKMAMYNGDEQPGFTRFSTTQAFTLVPSSTYDADAEDIYLIATSNGNYNGNGYIQKFKLSGAVNNPELTYQGAIGIPEPWANGAGDAGNFLPQLGSSELINSVDARMETVIYRNSKLWAVHHVYLPANDPQRTAVQWWALDTSGVILERGRIDDTTNVFSFAFASIAVNANEDIFIGHNVFSNTQYASAGYSYKANYDDPNSMRTYYQYKDGISPYYKTFGGGRNRWGDYSTACVDPVNDIDFWALQEYAEQEVGSSKWGTWWAQVKPSFVPVADFKSNEILIPVGETVNFTDLTVGVPSQWEWTFESAIPETSGAQNPAAVLYPEEGVFAVSLIATNNLGTDTIIKSTQITANYSILPEVAFVANKEIVCTGNPVLFTDQTQYSPNQWEWQFDPSTITFVNGTDQTSQNPEVIFDIAGNYAVTLKSWNLNGESELTKFDMIAAGGYQPWFAEEFEIDGFDRHHWTIENPDNSNSWEIFEVGGNTPGNKAAGINFSDYLIGKRDRLISAPFNLTNMTSAWLEFQHAYAKKYEPLADSLIVYVSADCGENWTRVFADSEDGSGNFATHELTDDFWPETTSDWCGSGWGASCITINLENWLGQADIRIAFESFSAIGNPLFIDNINISQYVGIEDEISKENKIIVFPNPADENFTISLPPESGFTELQLQNYLGQIVFSSSVDDKTNSIEIQRDPKWKAGAYFLKLTGTKQTISKKVILY